MRTTGSNSLHPIRKSCEKIHADELHEECGVFGCMILTEKMLHRPFIMDCLRCSTVDRKAVVLQSVRQTDPKGKVTTHKDMGLVNEVFTQHNLESMQGDIGVSHVRYSTAGASTRENAQPLVLNYVKGTLHWHITET